MLSYFHLFDKKIILIFMFVFHEIWDFILSQESNKAAFFMALQKKMCDAIAQNFHFGIMW